MNKYRRKLPQDLRLLVEAYEDDKQWLEALACAAATATVVLMACFC